MAALGAPPSKQASPAQADATVPLAVPTPVTVSGPGSSAKAGTILHPAAKAAIIAPPLAPAHAAQSGGAGPVVLTLAIPPGPEAEALRAMLQPYADATATRLGEVIWDGARLDGLKSPPPDLVLASGGVLLAGCKSQALTHLNWGALGRDRYLSQATSDCGAGAYFSATALAWDLDKLAVTPRWTDFWDVARYPGGRGLQRVARGNLEIALLADGVSAGDVYHTLRTNDGLDRAFRKLDQLKPYIIWWDKPDQPAQLLSAGHVLMTSSPTAALLRAGNGAHRRYGLQWTDSLDEVQSWAIPQGAEHGPAAMAALLIVSDIARQAEFARASGLGPSVRGAIDLLPAVVKAGNPSAPANLAGSLQIDEGFWLENQAKLAARFAAWAAK
jgi:putative spermidine/putrescine transport system substrate-binding protein